MASLREDVRCLAQVLEGDKSERSLLWGALALLGVFMISFELLSVERAWCFVSLLRASWLLRSFFSSCFETAVDCDREVLFLIGWLCTGGLGHPMKTTTYDCFFLCDPPSSSRAALRTREGNREVTE